MQDHPRGATAQNNSFTDQSPETALQRRSDLFADKGPQDCPACKGTGLALEIELAL